MTWCSHCAKNSKTHSDSTTVWCVDCGKVVFQNLFTEDATFVKDAAGGVHLAGNLVRMQSDCYDSHRRTLNKGNDVINALIDKYGISNVDHATKFYQIAVERGFTRGRRTRQVAAACLYVACREMEKPFLLIEFSIDVGVSVYALGSVYLQLCKLLNLQDHPFVQKPVDPSLFMHRYTHGLMQDGNNKKVLNTALHLVVSMKRDWIQTGRKPSGICAAAIYVSSLLHGYNFSKTNVVQAVHICEATLTKRLIEFENTEAGSLTIEEFTQKAMDYEKEMQSCKQSADDLKMPGTTEVVCQHKSSAVQSGFGLCKDCYLEFCGGLDGSQPPAFQCAKVENSSKEFTTKSTESTPQETVHDENGTQGNMKRSDNTGASTEVDYVATNSGKIYKTSDSADSFESSKESPASETDSLSDIDDFEINGYLLDKEESRLKKIIWEHMNPEHMQEEAAAAAARKLHTGNSKEIHEANATASQVVASKKEKDKRKRELETQNSKPAQTAAEAACQHFKKRISSKINYDVLADLFGDEEPSPKKNRVDDGGDSEGKEIASEDNNDEMHN